MTSQAVQKRSQVALKMDDKMSPNDLVVTGGVVPAMTNRIVRVTANLVAPSMRNRGGQKMAGPVGRAIDPQRKARLQSRLREDRDILVESLQTGIVPIVQMAIL